jgi:hypothetical protein
VVPLEHREIICPQLRRELFVCDDALGDQLAKASVIASVLYSNDIFLFSHSGSSAPLSRRFS